MLFDKKTIHFILPLESLLKVSFLYKITAYVHLGLPSLWFVEAVLETRYWVPAHSHFIFATVVYRHKWSLFSACALLSTSCSLCKRVCPHQLASSSDYLGLLLCPCQWNLWVKLTTADWVYNSYTTFLTARGYHLTPFLSVLPWWHESLFLLNEGILGGPWCSPPHLYPHSSNVWASLRADC